MKTLHEKFEDLEARADNRLTTLVSGKNARNLSLALGKSYSYINTIRPRENESQWGGTLETKLSLIKKLEAMEGEKK